MGERGRHRVGAAIGPEQRRREQDAIIWLIALAFADVEAILDNASVREWDRLGPAAGARRVDDDCIVGCAWPDARGRTRHRRSRGQPVVAVAEYDNVTQSRITGRTPAIA